MVKTLLFVLLFICPPPLKPPILRWFCGARIGRGVHIGWFASVMGRNISIGDYSEIRPLTLLRCDGDIALGAYTIISSFNLIYGAASFHVGNHAYIGPQSLINVDEDVRIGTYSALGARCMIFTHGSFLPYTEGYWVRFGKVTLGNYVWCAAGVFIHPGVSIGDNVFVNSRSVLSEDIPAGEVVEGFPARTITSMAKLKRTMTPRRLDAVAWQMLKHFAEIGLRHDLGLTVNDTVANRLSFSYRGQDYLLLCVPSNAAMPIADAIPTDTRLICLLNHPDLQLPPLADAPLILDLRSMRTSFPTDPIHHALKVFLQRYYGVQFEYAD